jgi:8-oxo-dGTP pyrophosphatase MutT (NUDIX family)
MTKKFLAGGIVIGPDNKILVVNQNRDSWSLPKGVIEAGENKLATAKREIYEESGIKPENLKLVKKLPSYQRTRIAKGGRGEVKGDVRVIHMYLFKTNQTELSPIDLENPEARWVETDQVSRLLTHPKDKQFFDSIKDLLA